MHKNTGKTFFYNRKVRWTSFLYTILGSGLMALAIQFAYEPSHLVTGGFGGIGIIIRNMTMSEEFPGIPLGLTTFLLNIPLFIWGYKVCGMSFIKKSLAGMVSLSLWLTIIPTFTVKKEDLVLTALVGGVLTGAGIGLIFLRGATTGGTDMLATLLHRYFPQYPVMTFLQVIDGVVIVIGAMWFGVHRAIYALIAIVVTAKVSDGIMAGVRYSKMAYIVTAQPGKIAAALMEKLNRGVTAWEGTGMYTGKRQIVLWCVVGKNEVVTLRKLVHDLDENAFLIFSDAREVYGEGFLPVEKY